MLFAAFSKISYHGVIFVKKKKHRGIASQSVATAMQQNIGWFLPSGRLASSPVSALPFKNDGKTINSYILSTKANTWSYGSGKIIDR